MTVLSEVELGEDLNDLSNNHPDFYNLSGMKFDDCTLYLVKKHIGYYPLEDKSGIFVLEAKIVDDDLINKMF
jgi:hypothetical protein